MVPKTLGEWMDFAASLVGKDLVTIGGKLEPIIEATKAPSIEPSFASKADAELGALVRKMGNYTCLSRRDGQWRLWNEYTRSDVEPTDTPEEALRAALGKE